MAGAPDSIIVDGQPIRVTHPDRVLYTSDGTTKADVIAYYVHMASRLVPLMRRRPVTRIRWPSGVEGESFYERNVPTHAPDWIERVTLDHSDGAVTYVLVTGAATLAWLAQHSALELHVPQWRLFGESRRTDRIVFDLDPGPGLGLRECATVAQWIRGKLDVDGLPSVPVTSGSKGIHMYARWRASQQKSSPSQYAKELAVAAQRALPELVTVTMAKRLREGRVLIDWSQNNPAKTTVTPYSLRGRANPWVAAPRDWSDMASPKLAQLTMSEVIERLPDPDPFELIDG